MKTVLPLKGERQVTALLTDEEIERLAQKTDLPHFVSHGMKLARSIYEARLAEAMRLLREIASYEPLSDSDGGFISTWEEIEAFLAIYAKEDKS